ncbi:cation diffusion facilitator CzcD-associated flavoprotein CzcO [Nocardia tenerifensis]|uniref:Cation diffusion facilitator CzcD-associated flavoprotein CzcO n=1 Tax=Nocardia tenerifensis TaxID=228006 RepID=A0A318K9N7_9NOCA|nr:NAD(P)/FAD-dependent oxidoreductase [Nocardia tenerifensis]PXX71271.1 cation diffusion facilitator CzcD-associated flavoprotein CzcO [Nocardia tenerifensis]
MESTDQVSTVHPNVLIVGTGLAGIGMAIKLLEAGERNFVVLEKADGVGGVWRDNTYPGCACDIMSMMYSYSFAPNTGWSRMYASQPEILDYIRRVVKDYEVEPYIRFQSEVVSYEFDDAADRWVVRTADGDEYRPRAVVAAHGALHKPHIPEFKGREKFTGPVFHSARWDHSVDLAGKRVAVIGTGASGIQLVPHIADTAAHVEVFQRSAHWVLPKMDRPVSGVEQRLFKAFPGVMKIYRSAAFWLHEAPVYGYFHPRWNFLLKAMALHHLKKQVPDPELRAKLTPDYTFGCKRILFSGDFFPALQRPDVDLVTEGIEEFTEAGIRTSDGVLHEADVIVLGTGFATDNRCATEHIVGRDGLTIQEAWRDGMQAYLGMTVAGFPNFFMIMGPNSGGSAQSILFLIESQVRYIVGCLRMMNERGSTRLEVHDEVQRTFNTWLHSKLDRSVWVTGGCHSWFLDHTGHNRQSWPGTGTNYWRATRRPEPEAFHLSTAGR